MDGFTSGTPLQVVLDGRDALLAVAMNGQPLPVAHGFPARMVVPGLSGYVSATKWVTDIEVTTFAAARAYWVQRGWSQRAPMETESRIDVPAANSTIAPGRTPVAGVASARPRASRPSRSGWTGARGTRSSWPRCPISTPGGNGSRMWDAAPGNHLLEARASDATGYTQTAVTAAPTPNGASGYPSAGVTVRASLRLRPGMRGGVMDREADREFATLAGEYLDNRAGRHPSVATSLGDHRFDDRLPDLSAAALADERRALDGWGARLEALDAATLSASTGSTPR